MSTITSAIVKDFWSYMMTKYDSTVVTKSDSEAMELVAGFLDLIKVTDKEDFMTNFTTTIGTTIYTPFEVGVDGYYSLWDQVETCVHEHQHVIQYHREGPIKFAMEYAFSKSQRAWYEAEGYRADLELHYWRTGELLTPRAMATHLDGYGLGEGDIKFVEEFIDSSLMTIKEGGIISESAQVAIEWFDKYHPEFRKI